MIHDKKLLGACGETELAKASNPWSRWCRLAFSSFLFLLLVNQTVFLFRCMNTLSRIIWLKHSRVFSVSSPVCLVVSPYIDCEPPTRTSPCSLRTSSSKTTRKIVSTPCTWRTSCILVKIVTWPRSSSSISLVSRRSSFGTPMRILLLLMTGRCCFLNVGAGLTRRCTILENLFSWNNFVDSAVSLCVSWSWLIFCRHWRSLLQWLM